MSKKTNLTNLILMTIIMYSTTVTAVFADAAASAKQSNVIGQFGMMAILFGAMYFLMIRPQSKRAKEHQNLLANIIKGDEIITTGGLLGKVNKITDQFLVLAVADGVEVTVQRQAVVQILPKGTIKSL